MQTDGVLSRQAVFVRCCLQCGVCGIFDNCHRFFTVHPLDKRAGIGYNRVTGGVPVSTGSLHQGKRVEACCNLFNPVARLNINANKNITVSSRSLQVAA